MTGQSEDNLEISGLRFTKYVLPFAISQTLAWATCFYSFPAFLEFPFEQSYVGWHINVI